MNAFFRSLALHQAHFHKTLLDTGSVPLSLERAEALMEGLVYDGLWLTKFPLLYAPRFDLLRLDALNKAWQSGRVDPAEVAVLRPLVDADLVRFVLALKAQDLEQRVEIFFGGRAMNKVLSDYLLVWFEHGAALRGRVALKPTMLDTVI